MCHAPWWGVILILIFEYLIGKQKRIHASSTIELLILLTMAFGMVLWGLKKGEKK